MRRTTAAILAAAAVLLVAAAPVLAQDATLTITNLLCPTEYAGSDYAADCTEPPDPPLTFVVNGPTPSTADPDDSGVVTFSGLAPGTYEVTGGVPGEFAATIVECQATSGDASDSLDGAILTIELGEDAVVQCTWWNVPEDLSGLPPNTAMVASRPWPAPVGVAMVLAAGALLARERRRRVAG